MNGALLLLLLLDGDGEATQQGPLVGLWTEVATLEALSVARAELQLPLTRTELQVRSEPNNLEVHK